MKITRTYRYRLYPNAEQRLWMARQFGSCRFVYNHFLRARIDHYAANKDAPTGPKGKGLTFADCCRMLTQLKKQPETAWLSEVGAQALQGALVDLDRAYNNFFNKRAAFPTFHRRGRGDSYAVPQNFVFDQEAGTVRLPKVGHVKAVFHRPIPKDARVRNLRVTKTPSGKHHVSVCVEEEVPEPTHAPGPEIGVDLGLKDYVVTSNGEHVPAPKHLRKAEKRLKRCQRALSRRIKGSNGRQRARQVLAKQHEKVTNRRHDFIHKLTRRLTRENQAISVETLNIKGMVQNHRLAKSISDAAWGEFLRQLAYKGSWYGCRINQVDRFFPSSKRCSTAGCGWINEGLTLKDRTWTCPRCGTVHDRDENAAKNILCFGTAGAAETASFSEDADAGGVLQRTSKPETILETG